MGVLDGLQNQLSRKLNLQSDAKTRSMIGSLAKNIIAVTSTREKMYPLFFDYLEEVSSLRVAMKTRLTLTY